jgi:hypothetical protein
MKSKIFLALAIVSLGAYSCVSPKKLQEKEDKIAQGKTDEIIDD